MIKPLYNHDCFECEYLGPYGDDESAPVDLWIHVHENGDHDLLTRYSDYGPDYGFSTPMALKMRVEQIGPDEYWKMYQTIIDRATQRGLI